MPRLCMNPGNNLVFLYKNGKTEEECHVTVRHIWYGKTWPSQNPQWFMSAFDLNKEDYRDFRINDMRPVD